MIPKLLIVIVLTLHVHNLKGQIISIRFAKEDFGFVNESENSFVTLVVEKDGISENDLTVIIEVQVLLQCFLLCRAYDTNVFTVYNSNPICRLNISNECYL